MRKWTVVGILGVAQFVMILDGTVMNVSISTVVKDLDTSVSAMQAAITFYTLTMAAFMLLGAKLGDVWGRRRAFVVGCIVYGVGSLTTALSPNIATLFVGWSTIEGLGAVLVIPAIAALIADNYTGRDRITSYAIIGAISGAAVAAGPLIGGFVTTYFDWRYVFVSEVVIMAVVVALSRKIVDTTGSTRKVRIDILSVLLSAAGLVSVVFGMLQSKEWGWILPLHSPEIGGVPLAPLNVSMTTWLILLGALLLACFAWRQRHLLDHGRDPLLDMRLFGIRRLRSGLSVLGAQYAITAGLFFMVPVYLQMTLGFDALQTGIRIFPLSISLILFSIVGTRLAMIWSPRRIVRLGQIILVASAVVLLGAIDPELGNVLFAAGMFAAGSALGLLASQLGNVTMSSVSEDKSSEVGGMQGVFQNLGSSLGTALVGSVMISILALSFTGAVSTSTLPASVQQQVQKATEGGVQIIPVASVQDIAEKAGLDATDAQTLTTAYSEAQLKALRVALVALIILALGSLAFSRGIPGQVLGRKPDDAETATGAAEKATPGPS